MMNEHSNDLKIFQDKRKPNMKKLELYYEFDDDLVFPKSVESEIFLEAMGKQWEKSVTKMEFNILMDEKNTVLKTINQMIEDEYVLFLNEFGWERLEHQLPVLSKQIYMVYRLETLKRRSSLVKSLVDEIYETDSFFVMSRNGITLSYWAVAILFVVLTIVIIIFILVFLFLGKGWFVSKGKLVRMRKKHENLIKGGPKFYRPLSSTNNSEITSTVKTISMKNKSTMTENRGMWAVRDETVDEEEEIKGVATIVAEALVHSEGESKYASIPEMKKVEVKSKEEPLNPFGDEELEVETKKDGLDSFDEWMDYLQTKQSKVSHEELIRKEFRDLSDVMETEIMDRLAEKDRDKKKIRETTL